LTSADVVAGNSHGAVAAHKDVVAAIPPWVTSAYKDVVIDCAAHAAVLPTTMRAGRQITDWEGDTQDQADSKAAVQSAQTTETDKLLTLAKEASTSQGSVYFVCSPERRRSGRPRSA